MVFLLCASTILVLGLIYAYIWVAGDRVVSTDNRRNPLLLATALAIAFGYGVACRLFVKASSRYAQISSDNILLLHNACFGVFAVYTSWLMWFSLVFGELHLSPFTLWSGIAWLVGADLKAGRGGNEVWQIYLPWVIEAFTIFLTIFIPFGKPKHAQRGSGADSSRSISHPANIPEAAKINEPRGSYVYISAITTDLRFPAMCADCNRPSMIHHSKSTGHGLMGPYCADHAKEHATGEKVILTTPHRYVAVILGAINGMIVGVYVYSKDIPAFRNFSQSLNGFVAGLIVFAIATTLFYILQSLIFRQTSSQAEKSDFVATEAVKISKVYTGKYEGNYLLSFRNKSFAAEFVRMNNDLLLEKHELNTPTHDPPLKKRTKPVAPQIFSESEPLKQPVELASPVLTETKEERIDEWRPVNTPSAVPYSRVIELRGVDVEVADAFMFYTSINWHARSHKEPTGIPMHTRDYDHHRPADERYRKTIPPYSTDEKEFNELERRVKAFGLNDLYLQFLMEEGQDETTATLEQKCIAMVKARKRQITGRR
jgi:hypothetical protein